MYDQEKFAWEYAEKHNLDLNTIALPTLTEKTVLKNLKVIFSLKQ